MKIVAIVWQSYYNLLFKSAKKLNHVADIRVYSSRVLDKDPERLKEAIGELKTADVVFFYRSNEPIWEILEKEVRDKNFKAKIISLGHDPSFWYLSNVSHKILLECYRYLVINGEKNLTNMFKFILNKILKKRLRYDPPEEIPWEGLYHPKSSKIFKDIKEYLLWYDLYWTKKSKGTIGILFSRHYWINSNTDVEDLLICELEQRGFKVISGFAYSVKDEALGTKGSGELVLEWFLDKEGNSRIDGFVKLISFFLGTSRDKSFDKEETSIEGVEILKRLGVPCFCPISSYYKTIEEWEKEELNFDIGWSVALPEFEGVIEPLIISGQKDEENDERKKVPIKERVKKFVNRVERWVELRKTPISDRRVSFILHNNPCASVEATVGSAANLDSLESIVEILKKMKKQGYRVEVPKDGKALIKEIMEKKAISEFRWTTVDEIVSKGGAVAFVDKEKYLKWFNELSDRTKQRMIESWGNPPGEEKNGIPPAMVYDGKIVITGIRLENVTIHVQPKRGCAGSKCDGRVCKILHDPDVPPPHQYIATYKWISKEFKAHVIVHVGTHGNLEFLPGKGVGLSKSCFSDISIDTIPHLYIYNADNPPEGTIAKRRSYAVLVDHMQTVMVNSGVYGELEELDKLVEEYEDAKLKDPGRIHVLQHLILSALKKSNFDKEIKINWKGKSLSLSDLDHNEIHQIPFEKILDEIHNRLTLVRTSQIQDGMHILGKLPKGDRRADFIYSILRYDSGKDFSIRKEVAKLLGYDISKILEDPKQGRLLEEIDAIGREIVKVIIEQGDKLV